MRIFNELDWRSYIIRWRKVTQWDIADFFRVWYLHSFSREKGELFIPQRFCKNEGYMNVFLFFSPPHPILMRQRIFCLNPSPSPNEWSNYRLLLFGHQSTWHKRWPRLRIIFFDFHAGATIRRASTRYDLHFILKKERKKEASERLLFNGRFP